MNDFSGPLDLKYEQVDGSNGVEHWVSDAITGACGIGDSPESALADYYHHLAIIWEDVFETDAPLSENGKEVAEKMRQVACCVLGKKSRPCAIDSALKLDRG